MRIIVFSLIAFFYFSQYIFAGNSNTIHFACPQWKPMFYSEGEKIKGLYVEYLETIFSKNMNIKVKYSIVPWKRAQMYVEKGDADLILTVPTKKRLTFSIKNEIPIYKMYLHIYTYKNHKKIDQIRRIKTAKDILNLNLTPVTNLGNGWHKQQIDSHGINTYYVPKEDNIVQFLASKRADIMIEAVIPMNYKIKQYKLVPKIELTNARFGPLNFHILMSKKSRFIGMIPAINWVIKKLHKSQYFKNTADRYSALN